MPKFELSFADTMGVAWYCPPITIACYFDGIAPIDYLHSKIKLILASNPWLLGGLKCKNGKVFVDYEALSDSFDPSAVLVTAVNDAVFAPTVSYEQLCHEFSPLQCTTGELTYLRKKPLFKVSIVKNSSNDKFVLLLSQCHTLGDAKGFYNILRMLSEEQEVTELDPVRHENVVRNFDQLVPLEEKQLLFAEGMMIFGTLYHQWFNKKTCSGVYLINDAKVNEEKQRLSNLSSTSFVSTNDILTSWIGRMVDSEFFFISVNVRKQISRDMPAEHDDSKMYGNYCKQLLFQRGDYESPELIRQALPNLQRVVTYPEMPNTYQRLRQKGYMFLTNWAGVQQDKINLPNSQMIRQIPISGCALGVHLANLFKYNENQLALLMVTSESAHRRFTTNEEGFILEKVA